MEKHFWWGLLCLAVLLAAGLWIGAAMGSIHDPAAAELAQAAQAAIDGQMEKAENYVNRAKEKWDSAWGFTACVADHDHMDEIDSLFSQLDIWSKENRPVDYAGCCARLSSLLRAMAEAHRLNWQNIL